MKQEGVRLSHNQMAEFAKSVGDMNSQVDRDTVGELENIERSPDIQLLQSSTASDGED